MENQLYETTIHDEFAGKDTRHYLSDVHGPRAVAQAVLEMFEMKTSHIAFATFNPGDSWDNPQNIIEFYSINDHGTIHIRQGKWNGYSHEIYSTTYVQNGYDNHQAFAVSAVLGYIMSESPKQNIFRLKK